MAKKKTKTKIVEEAAKIVQRYVRLKAADENGNCTCVTCGVVGHWKEFQGGHYIPRGCIATKLMEENVHPQCRNCNGPQGGNYRKYAFYIEDMYGREMAEWLEAQRMQVTRYSMSDAKDWLEEWKEKWKILSEERKELL